MPDTADLLRRVAEQSISYLDGVADRPVGRPVAADALRSFYEGWSEEEPRRRRRGRRPEGLVLAKPACPPDTGANPIAASI